MDNYKNLARELKIFTQYELDIDPKYSRRLSEPFKRSRKRLRLRKIRLKTKTIKATVREY